MKVQDIIISNFNGLVTDKSDLEMQNGELKDVLNMDFDDDGRLKRRRGMQRFGQILTSKVIDNSTIFTLRGTSQQQQHLVISREADGALYKIVGNYLTANLAVSAGAGTMTVANNAFAPAGASTMEIDGGVVIGTKSGTTEFTSVTSTQAHSAYSLVNLFITVSAATGIDTTMGCYFAQLGNLLMINGRAGSASYDGTTVSAIADADEPNGLFATNYRDRIYLAGVGANSARTYFSDAGDMTSWTAANYFDVQSDDLGEMITGYKILNDTLGIFKANGIFTYNEVQLEQQLFNVGAYNHRVIQNINGTIITACPSGVWETNLFTAKRISDPIKPYLDAFRPFYDSVAGRVVLNCFSAQYDGKYLLFLKSLGDPYNPTNTTNNSIVLVWDTKKRIWTKYDSFTNFSHLIGLPTFYSATVTTKTANFLSNQQKETLFGGTTVGTYYKFYETRYLDSSDVADPVYRGTDIVGNLISSGTSNALSTVAQTKYIPLGNPLVPHKIGELGIISEQGDFNLSYSLDKGTSKTDWIPVGELRGSQIISLKKDNEGYRIALKVTSNTKDVLGILNALVIRNIDSLEKDVNVQYARK